METTLTEAEKAARYDDCLRRGCLILSPPPPNKDGSPRRTEINWDAT